jgi:transcriptional regulator with XRE-family HTH domain
MNFVLDMFAQYAYIRNMTRSDDPTLGREIHRCRTRAAITLRKFAERVEISPGHLSDIEHDRRGPSRELLQRIADELAPFGVTHESLDRLMTRLEPDIQEWVSETPEVRQLLRSIRESQRDMGEVLGEVQELLRRDKKGRSR